MKICILGTGVYGIALSKVLDNGNNEINMWTNSIEEVNFLKENRFNPAMKDIKLKENIDITNNLEEAIKDKDVLLVAIPTRFLNNVFEELKKIVNEQYIVIASKGINDQKNDFLSNSFNKYDIDRKLGFISGPTFAHDLATGSYGVVTAASENAKTLNIIEKMFINTNVNISKSTDIYGVQLLGTVKNVMAIIMGMASELELSETSYTKLLLIMLDEVKKMLLEFGGQERTLMERAGIGDIILTCFNEKSRNYTFGKLLALDKEKADEYIKTTTVEGLSNLIHLKQMINKRNNEYDFVNILYNIIYDNADISILKDYLKNEKIKRK